MVDDGHEWHLDKRVPIAFIAALFLQTLFLVSIGTAWKTETDNSLGNLEGRAERLEDYDKASAARDEIDRANRIELDRRLIVVEQHIDFITTTLKEIRDAVVKKP